MTARKASNQHFFNVKLTKMKKIIFSLSQTNGNRVSFEFETIKDGLTQDEFAGTYLFPAMMRLVKGSHKMFDKALPVFLSFAAEVNDGDTINKVLANIRLKSSAPTAVRKAVLTFNETIAGLIVPAVPTSIYAIADMGKDAKDRGAAFRQYSKALLRPSVSLEAALMPSTN